MLHRIALPVVSKWCQDADVCASSELSCWRHNCRSTTVCRRALAIDLVPEIVITPLENVMSTSSRLTPASSSHNITDLDDGGDKMSGS